MTERGVVTGGAIAFALLAAWCVWHHRDMAAGAAVVSSANLPVVGARAPQISAVYTPPTIVLNGNVPDMQSRNAIVQRAQQLYGTTNVQDQLVIDKLDNPAWFAQAHPQFPPDLRQTVRGSATLVQAQLTVEGVAPNQAALDATTGKLTAQPPVAELTLQNKLTVAAPTAAAQQIATNITQQLQLQNIEFDTGKDTLTPRGQAVLDKITPFFAQDRNSKFMIEGHTDSQGDPQRNLDLSMRRAQTVRDYLVSKGVEAQRLQTAGFGDTQPVASNDSREGRQKNRRIQFKPAQ